MPKIVYKIILLLAFALLLLLSLWPGQRAHEQSGEVPSGRSPQEGDNFKAANDPRVYRLEAGKKRAYLSSTSYFADWTNPPYGTPYAAGGILICDSALVVEIPLGQPVPLTKAELNNQKSWQRFLHGDKLGHLVLYFLFSLLFLLAFYDKKKSSRQYLLFFLLLWSIGLGIEYLQGFFSQNRNFEWEDILMNSWGIGLALGGHFIFFRLFFGRFVSCS